MSIPAAVILLAFALLARRQSERGGSGFWTAGQGRLATGVFAASLLLSLWATTGVFDFLLAVLALLLLLPGPLRPRPALESPAFLETGVVTLLVGLVSAAVAGIVWNSLDPVARVQDEAAYLLQARLFASGRWVGAARPLPEFFEQIQVFVTPVLASKYPPGHSLVLVPGIWLKVPALMPLILNAAAGSLVFAHARRLAGAWVGLVTWLLWVSAPGTLGYRASYLSQNTTTVLWLLALWSLREWLSSGSRRRLVLLAACLGLGAITRPMTMFAVALPIGFVVLRRVTRTRRWGDLAIGAVAGGLFLALGVLWSVRTIGEWKTTPYRQYSRIYFPYEWTGFGARADAPLRRIPPGLDALDRDFRQLHAEHRVSALPKILTARLRTILADQWSQGRSILEAFAVFGSLSLCREGLFAVGSAALVVLGHLFMAHFDNWTVYYLEIQPVMPFLAALGVCGAIASTLAVLGPSARRRAQAIVGSGLVLILAGDVVVKVNEAREERQTDAAAMAAFREGVKRLPGKPVIVFVRYGPNHDTHRSLVVNEPDLASADAWIVHDLGARDELLIALAPNRKAYRYDEPSGLFTRLRKD